MKTNPGICDSFESKNVMLKEEETNVLWGLFVYFYTLAIGLMIMALVCICIARRAAKKDVNEEVKKSVAHYFSMKEVESLQ